MQNGLARAAFSLPVSYDEVRSLTLLPDGRAAVGGYDNFAMFDPRVTGPDSRPGPGPDPLALPDFYVLSVGVTAYRGEFRLIYAHLDARAIERTFREHCGTLCLRIEVKLLADAQASRAEFLRGLTWLRKQMPRRDIGAIFFSAHGFKDGDKTLDLLPVDGDPDDLLAAAVSADQLKATLASLLGRVIALLDACHAGGDRRRPPQGGGRTHRRLRRDRHGQLDGPGVLAGEQRQSRGDFTVTVTEGLSGQADVNKDGSPT